MGAILYGGPGVPTDVEPRESNPRGVSAGFDDLGGDVVAALGDVFGSHLVREEGAGRGEHRAVGEHRRHVVPH
jgi:hypothetical protein